jgi:hypothetical protein
MHREVTPVIGTAVGVVEPEFVGQLADAEC